MKVKALSRLDRHSAGWLPLIPAAVLALLLLAVGSGVYRKSSQAIAPPMYDAMSYYGKAAAVWRAIDSDGLVNPLNIEPVVRPPGVILLSGPFGFSADFRPFFFRGIFLPIVLFIAACWLVAHERLRDPREHWLITGACAAALALPMFYHFEGSDILPVSASWGLVDGFLAGVAAQATALLIVGVRRRSLALTIGGTLAGAFTLLIKPSGLVVVPVIFWAWFSELLIVNWPIRSAWRRERRVRSYVMVSSVAIVVVVGLTAFACFNSRYLSRDTLRFFTNSQRLLAELYRGVPLAPLIAAQVHPWLGWHWTALFGAIIGGWSVGAVVRATRHRLDRDDLRILMALVALAGGVIWWMFLAGPSEMRYVLPFVLVFVVSTLPMCVSRAAALGTQVRRICCLALTVPVMLLVVLLWADRPSPFLQRMLGVTLASGQFRDEVQIGHMVGGAAEALKRDLVIYAVGTDVSHGMVEAVGAYRRLVEPNRNAFRTVFPIDWKRPPLIRREELLGSDYVLFRPMAAAEITQWQTTESIDGFGGETQVIRAWLTNTGVSDGFEVSHDGPLRLLRIVDLGAADRSFGMLRARHRWRDLFSAENDASLLASEADIERARSAAAPGTSGVEFAGTFRLHGATVIPVGRGVEMELLWEDLGAAPANWWVFVHVLERDGKVVFQADYPLRALRPGLRWRNKMMWPNEQLREAKRVGIGIYQLGGSRLKADGGDRDGNDTRVLIELPR